MENTQQKVWSILIKVLIAIGSAHVSLHCVMKKKNP